MAKSTKRHRWPKHDNRGGRIECEYEDRCLDCDLLKRTPGPRPACIPTRQPAGDVEPSGPGRTVIAKVIEDVAGETSDASPKVRPAELGELCTCGRQAIVVFLRGASGDTAYCGIADGGDQSGPCPFCGGHRHEGRCPRYRLRLDGAGEGGR